MSHSSVIGMDISKRVFHVVELTNRGQIVLRKLLKRDQVLSWFAQHAPCQVGMEACASSHYWGRSLPCVSRE